MAGEVNVDATLNDKKVARVLEHMRLENAHEFAACIAVFDRPRYEIIATGEVHDGTSGVAGLLDENKTAFSDFFFEVTSTVPAGNDVLVEGFFTGTHDGPWRGLPATGRKVRVKMCVIFAFDGDTMLGERLYFDLGTVLRQLGVARDPLSLSGRLTTLVNHPLTIVRALLRSLIVRGPRPQIGPKP
jgi:steroid delta-isomerase-like uncharacterized protein